MDQHGRKEFSFPSTSNSQELLRKGMGGCRALGSPLLQLLLTWSPPHRPLAAAAEAHFAEHPEDVPLTQGASVFAGAGAALGG